MVPKNKLLCYWNKNYYQFLKVISLILVIWCCLHVHLIIALISILVLKSLVRQTFFLGWSPLKWEQTDLLKQETRNLKVVGSIGFVLLIFCLGVKPFKCCIFLITRKSSVISSSWHCLQKTSKRNLLYGKFLSYLSFLSDENKS